MSGNTRTSLALDAGHNKQRSTAANTPSVERMPTLLKMRVQCVSSVRGEQPISLASSNLLSPAIAPIRARRSAGLSK
jgi:hypothetical protein